MAMSAVLSMPYPPILNQAVQLSLVVSNSGAAPVNIQAVSPQVRGPNGSPVPAGAAYIQPPFSAPGLSVPQAPGGSQLNVPVPAGGSVTLPMQAVFYGPALPGGPTQPNMAYNVTADIMTSDGSVFQPQPILVAPSLPKFGTATWCENAGAGSAPPVGSLQFTDPLQSSLLL